MNLTKKFRRFANVMRLFVFGLPKNAVGSIDVTNRCNLRCEHCYFFAEDHDNERELSIEKWIEKLDAMKAAGHPMMLCTWVGGEPMVRKQLIEVGRKYFKHNTIVTNGTMELPDWPKRFLGAVDRDDPRAVGPIGQFHPALGDA